MFSRRIAKLLALAVTLSFTLTAVPAQNRKAGENRMRLIRKSIATRKRSISLRKTTLTLSPSSLSISSRMNKEHCCRTHIVTAYQKEIG